MLVLAGRLTQLQGLQAHVYADRAQAQRLHVINLPAVRGTITDRDGATLAQDVDARSVYANPTLVKNPGAVAAALSPVIGQPASRLLPKLRQRGEFVYLAQGLTPAVGDKVTAMALPGVGVVDTRRRFYPSGTLAADVLGFTSRGDNDTMVGMGGVESDYDSTLRGTAGLLRIEQDPAGRPIPSAQTHQLEPVPGSAVRLTIDRDIQWAAQQAITEAVQSTGADGGTAIVMDPRTGEVLAMADAPTFDPNNIAAARPDTLSNRAVSDVYEPGSTNKVITVAAAVDAGLVTPSTPVTVPPHLVIDGRSFSDAEPHGTEHLTVAGVLAKSSNIGAIEISRELGRTRLEQALRAFGLGSATGLGLPGESAGVLPPAAQWDPQQAATIPFGQGMSATAMQMATVYATIANGGIRVRPKIIDSAVAPDGTVRPTPTDPGTRVVSPATARTVATMLESVTTDAGTAPAAAIPGYRVAGKTGTANRYDSTAHAYKGYVSSFIGFAPANNPRLVVDVVLDNPSQGYFGGAVAAPVFNKIMTFALATLGVPPTGTKPPKLVLDLDHRS
jgi:cell division protein FtsI (penicillin-binding protein 3)